MPTLHNKKNISADFEQKNAHFLNVLPILGQTKNLFNFSPPNYRSRRYTEVQEKKKVSFQFLFMICVAKVIDDFPDSIQRL